MTTEGRSLSTTIQSGANHGAASLFKAVAVGGTIAATPAAAIGLIMSKANTGEGLRVGFFGEMKAIAGDTISVGALLTVTASGFIITGTNSACIGKALTAAASGDVFRGLFNFAGL